MPEVEGKKKLEKQLAQLGRVARGKALRSAALSSTLPVLRAAQANAPVNDRDYLRKTYKGRSVAPGFLKRNIKRKTIRSRDGTFVRVMIGPTPEAFYGTTFVELGTSKMPRQPWLVPALDAKGDEAVGRFGRLLQKNINKVIR